MEDSKTSELKKQDMAALEQDDLENVTGGYVFHDSHLGDYNWEVINDETLRVMGRYKTKEEAQRGAINLGQDNEIIKSERKLKKMREKAKSTPRENFNRGLRGGEIL